MAPFSTDPNLEGLLRELAADDASRTLKVGTLAKGLGGLWNDDDWIRPTLTGLTSLERHLLDVHREEVAFAYRQVAAAALTNLDSVKSWDHGYYTVASQRQLPDLYECHRQVREATRRARSTGEGYPPPPESLDVRSAVQAAQSLRPTAQGSVYLGLVHLAEGDGESGKAGFWLATRSATVDLVRSIAWNDLGLALLLERDLEGAYIAYSRSCEYQPDSTPALFGRLSVAVEMKDKRRIDSASHAIDDVVPPDHPSIDAYLACVDLQKGLQRASADGTVGSASRRIIDAIL